MSLVNDVLRQLDNASSKPYQGMPLHSLMTGEPEKNNNVIRNILIALIVFLVIVIAFQFFYKQSLVDIFYSDGNKMLILPSHNLELTKTEAEVDLQVISISADVDELAEVDESLNEIPYKQVTLEEPSEKLRFKENLDNQAVESKAAGSKAVEKKETYQLAKINAVENIGFEQYQMALRAYKQKHSESALSWINLALNQEGKEEYLRLKVRILMQKGDGRALRKLALEQGNNTNLSWFELIGPSLQMYSYHELSNKYYSELIKQQPGEVKWPLAMALNYTKLGLNKKTYSIYKDLLNSSLLTYKQQKWIASRLESMQQGEVAINDK